MKRPGWLVLGFLLLWVQSPLLPRAFCSEISPSVAGNGIPAVAKKALIHPNPISGLSIRPDGFGGFLYSYVDEHGNRHVTNSIDLVPEKVRAHWNRTARSKSLPLLEARPDGFGGNLYTYMDREGCRHTTNSLALLPREFQREMTAGAFLPGEAGRISPGEERVPLVLARAEASQGSSGKATAPNEPKSIADPLEPLNRAIFYFNDRLYFWIIRPIAIGYRKLMPEPLRVCVRNFFSNLYTPVRAVNCLLQGKIKSFGTELVRFVVNTTMGVLGFGDPAKEVFALEKQDEDLGQTLGCLGIGPGIYINWPILGPSSVRDTVGLIGDAFLDPINYIVGPTRYNAAVRGYRGINETSLSIGEYEDLKDASLDPYVSLKDAYFQSRQHKIKK